MARNMSFSRTTEQIINRTKTVTRRLGWRNLRSGDRVWAVRKSMGLRKGEKVERLALLEIVDNRREFLWEVTADDVVREGFPEMSVRTFFALFVRINPRFHTDQRLSRIEFRYIGANETAGAEGE